MLRSCTEMECCRLHHTSLYKLTDQLEDVSGKNLNK